MEQFFLDQDRLQVIFSGQSVTLLPKEFALFQFLYQNHNQTFSREMLLDRVWPLEEPVDRTVDDHIYRLRKKLRSLESYLIIETIRGIGYRLRLIEKKENSSPSLKDEDFHHQFHQILLKYHLFGQGEALQTLVAQQKILGVKLEPFYEMYVELLKGNWGILLNGSIPFWERAYFMVVLYGLLNDNPAIGKDLIEKVVANNQLELGRQWELQAMDLAFFLIWTGDYHTATEKLDWASGMVLEHRLTGYRLAIIIQQIFPLTMIGSHQDARIKMSEAESLLKEKPYLRERSYFNINKGLCSVLKGDLSTARRLIDEGFAIMKQAKFELQLLHVLTHVSHILKSLLGIAHPLYLRFQNLREKLIQKNNGREWEKRILNELNSFL